MPAPMAEVRAGHTDVATNGEAAVPVQSQQLLSNGLENPWAVPATSNGTQQHPVTLGRRSDGTAPDGWGLDPHALGRRSKSLTLDDVEAAFSDAQRSALSAQLPPAEAASSRSWMKPFARKKRAARQQEEGSTPDNSLSGSGRTTFTPAQLQRAASARLPGEPAEQNVAPEAEAAAPASSGRRLWSRSQEHVAGRDPRLSSLSKADPASEVLERSRSSTEATSGSRWNLFSRGSKSAATTPSEPALLTSAQGGTDSSAATLTAEEPSSSEQSRRSSYEPAGRQADEQGAGHMPSPFAGGAALDDEHKHGDDGKKGHRRGRSLSSIMLNPLKMKGRRGSTADELDLVPAAEPPQRPKTPDPAKRASSGALGCFGVGPRVGGEDAAEIVRQPDAEDEGPALPTALVGLKNLGNTCFINAAVQCLRHTPGLALTVLPDLLTLQQASDSGPGTPKASAAEAGGSGASSNAPSAAGDSPMADSQGEGPLVAGAPAGAGLLKQPPVLGVVAATDSPVASIAAPEVLEATPEDWPLIADITQSPPVSFSSSSRDSSSQPVSTAAAAIAAIAATPDSSLLDVAAPPAVSPAAALQPLQPTDGAVAVPADAPPSDSSLSSHAATVGGTTASPSSAATAAAGDAPAGVAAAAAADAPDEAATQAPPAAVEVKPQRPPPPALQRGELLDAFKRLVREVYGRKKGSVDPVYLVKRLGALGAALGEDFTDGGQHDCEEVLSAIIDRLHEDLNRVETPEEPQQSPEADVAQPATPEPAQWQQSDGSGSGEPGTPTTPQTPNLSRPSHRLAMAGGLGRDSSQLGFGLRSLSLSSSVADHSEHGGDAAANGDAAPPQPEEKDDPNEPQDVKAERFWKRHLEEDDSPVTDLFGGQLQGNITCHGCKHRFTRYEFFKGLSLPLVREARSGLSSWFSAGKAPSSITDCLAAFTADEMLQGNKTEYYSCDECKGKTAATINMRIHRFPRILMLHIKRFTYTGTLREKLTTNVAFPLKGLRLGAFASEEAGFGGDKDGGPEYDLYAVINHTGTMAGGHYVATCRAPGAKDQWYTFNDEVVVKTQASSVATANAYILFYVRRNA